jgi:HAE1 family hydrophobic/amphiphilic exporter-1
LSSFDLFINRPVFTLMMTLSLIVFGVLGYAQLGVEQFPDMDFPVVTVTALLEGASPEVVEQDVTDILEEHINTIAGVRTLSSKSINGASSIKVEFELGTDIDIATQDVRDKVARARFELPPDVEPPVVDKEDFGDQPVLWFPVNSNRPLVEVSEWVRNHMKPRLETIPGVASAELFGNQDRAIRIWLDGDAMHARGLAVGDVLLAIRREHVEVPGGLIEGRALEYSVRTDAEFRSVAGRRRARRRRSIRREDAGAVRRHTDGRGRHSQAVRRKHRGGRGRGVPAPR